MIMTITLYAPDGSSLELTRDTEAPESIVHLIIKQFEGDQNTLSTSVCPATLRAALKRMMG
jgi:hypothetical protein